MEADHGLKRFEGLFDFRRRFDELYEDSLSTDRSFFAAFGVDEAHAMTSGSSTDSARREANALRAEPLHGGLDVVNP